jgi:hypothetical protein
VVVERSDSIYVMKLSHWLLRHLAVFGFDPTYEYANVSRRFIVEFMKKLGAVFSYGIPAIVTPTSRQLFKSAFSPSKLWDQFEEVHGA